MCLDASVFFFTRVTFSTEGISSHNTDTDLAVELETELELEAELPLEFEHELVDNFHGIQFLEVFSIFTTMTFTNLDFMHFYLMHFFRVSGSTDMSGREYLEDIDGS